MLEERYKFNLEWPVQHPWLPFCGKLKKTGNHDEDMSTWKKINDHAK